jgi:hypothetical protein
VKKLLKISTYLNDMPTDVRAEVLLAQAMDDYLKKNFLYNLIVFFTELMCTIYIKAM